MIIEVYSNFRKVKNSTKRPANAGREIEVTLKNDCSLYNPVFEIAQDVRDVNYIKWNNRYYYRTDLVFSQGRYIMTCVIDSLATWKSSIGQSTQYVLRSASEYDGSVYDNMYPTKSTCTTLTTNISGTFIYPSGVDNGCYILGVASNDNTTKKVGMITYFILDDVELKALAYSLLDITDLKTNIINPLQYIVSCMWIPISPARIAGDLKPIKVGGFSTDVSAYVVDDNVRTSYMTFSIGATISIPRHPSISTFGSYLNMSPYSDYTLYCYPFGNIHIDGSLLNKEYDTLYMSCHVDIVTGKAILELRYGGDSSATSTTIQSVVGNVGVPIQLAQLTGATLGDIATVVGGTMGAITSLASGNIVGGIASTASLISSAQGLVPTSQTQGCNGSFAGYTIKCYMVGKFANLVDIATSHKGRPLCKNRRIDTLSGYIMCSDSELELNTTPAIYDEIVGYMNSGFFFE